MHIQQAQVRFFNSREAEPRVLVRNPITQEGIPEKQIGEPSQSNPRGPGRATYSAKAQGSFKLAYPPSEIPTPVIRSTRDFNTNRNPITQETSDPCASYQAPIDRSQKFEKYNRSQIFEVSKEPLGPPLKNRSNQKFNSSRIFEGEEEIYKPLSKKVETRTGEVEKLLTHAGKDIKPIVDKPNVVRMNSAEFVRSKKEVNHMASVYNARRNISNITFS